MSGRSTVLARFALGAGALCFLFGVAVVGAAIQLLHDCLAFVTTSYMC